MLPVLIGSIFPVIPLSSISITLFLGIWVNILLEVVSSIFDLRLLSLLSHLPLLIFQSQLLILSLF